MSEGETFSEGARKQVVVNSFERNRKARAACLKHFGVKCAVCAFDFVERYGSIGTGFIHVHHTRPIALLKQQYRINAKTDLVPVCPNCHAMLHTSNPPLDVDVLRAVMAERSGPTPRATRRRRHDSADQTAVP